MRTSSILVLGIAACVAHSSPRPDDMSAAAHRQEAARERAAASERFGTHVEHPSGIDPHVPGAYGISPSTGQSRAGGLVERTGYSEVWAQEAHAEHARQHEAAAAELERFEAAECEAIPVEERAACPLLTGAGAVVRVAGGLEVRFREDAPVDEIYARMRCHYAYARAHGFSDASGCPLYVNGLRIERPAPRIIRLTTP